MGRFIFKSALTGFASILLASSLFAQNALLDDHSDASNQNEFEAFWYYYDDNSGVKDDDRPLAGPKTNPSVIDVDFDLVPRHAFGDTSDTWEVKEYTFVVGENSGDKYASMPFTLGDMWMASWCDEEPCASPYVGIGCMLAKEGSTLNLTGATGVKFRIRSKTNPLTVKFKAEQQDISDDSTFAYYQAVVAVTTAWSEETILFADMKQPTWAKAAQKVDFGITQLMKLAWEIAGEDNTGIETDELMIDDIIVLNFTYIPPSLWTTSETAAPGNGLFHHFEEVPRNGSPLETFWYGYNDVEIGGTSTVLSGATENATTGKLKFDFSDESGAGGNGYGALLEFKLGPSVEQPNSLGNNITIQGFMGIGINLYDSATATYFNATDGTIGGEPIGSGSSSSIYFQYSYEGDAKYLTFELSDFSDVGDMNDPERKDLRGSGIVHYRDLPQTPNNTWNSVLIPFSELVLHDTWEGYTEIPLDLTQLAKAQWKVQGAEGSAGYLQIDNIYFPGTDFGVGISSHSITKPFGNTGFATSYHNNNVMVNWKSESAVSGKINIVNTKGAVVVTVPVAHTSALNANISAARIPSGLYFVQFNGRDVRGNAVLQQSAVSIVK